MKMDRPAGLITSTYDRSAPRRAVNLSLNEDLLVRAKAATRNLSSTVEELLADFVHEDQVRRRREDEALAEVIAAVNAAHAEHELLSSEFSDL